MPERLTRLSSARPQLLDGLTALVLAGVSLLVIGLSARGDVRQAEVIGLTLAGAATVAIRRLYPVAAALGIGVLIAAGALAVPQAAHVGTLLASFLLVSYAAGAHTSPRAARAALAILLLAMASVYAAVAGQPATAPSEFVWELTFAAAPWGLGRLLRARRLLHASLEDRALALAYERDVHERLGVAQERARIARELHDVVAHSLSVMIVQAGGGRRVLGAQPAAAERALAAIGETGRQTLAEMDGLLGFLHRGPAGRSPSLEGLGELVAQARATGLPVALRLEGDPRPLPPDVEHAAYRIVQEGLTNAIKHSPGVPVSVLIAHEAAHVRVEVSDRGRPEGGDGHGLRASGSGHGLRGMRERVTALGGELHAGRRPEGGFALRARLPAVAASAGSPASRGAWRAPRDPAGRSPAAGGGGRTQQAEASRLAVR